MISMTFLLLLLTPSLAFNTTGLTKENISMKFARSNMNDADVSMAYEKHITKDNWYMNNEEHFGKAALSSYFYTYGAQFNGILSEVSYADKTFTTSSGKTFTVWDINRLAQKGFSGFIITKEGEVEVRNYLGKPLGTEFKAVPTPNWNAVELTTKTSKQLSVFDGGIFDYERGIEYLPFLIEFQGTIEFPLERSYPEDNETFAYYLHMKPQTQVTLYMDDRKRASYATGNCDEEQVILIVAPIKNLFEPETAKKMFGEPTQELSILYLRNNIRPGQTLGKEIDMFDVIKAYEPTITQDTKALDTHLLGNKLFFLKNNETNKTYKFGLKHRRFLYETAIGTSLQMDPYISWLQGKGFQTLLPNYMIADDGLAYEFTYQLPTPKEKVILHDFNIGHYGEELSFLPETTTCNLQMQSYGTQTHTQEELASFVGEENLNKLFENGDLEEFLFGKKQNFIEADNLFGTVQSDIPLGNTGKTMNAVAGMFSVCSGLFCEEPRITTYMGDLI